MSSRILVGKVSAMEVTLGRKLLLVGKMTTDLRKKKNTRVIIENKKIIWLEFVFESVSRHFALTSVI
jgi:hypothetical protein